MGRKVLISFLGTGPIDQTGRMSRNYHDANYKYEDQEIRSKFVTSVLSHFLKVDQVLVFGTVKSMWEVLYQHICEVNEMNIDHDLAFRLYEMSDVGNANTPISNSSVSDFQFFKNFGWNPYLIHYGINDEQIEHNFSIIADALNELPKNSTIYLDITHSFRSLPLMSISAIDYLNTVNDKKLSVDSIFYGMLDVSRELGYTPIVKLNYLLKLQKWAKGGYAFLEYGDTDLICSLLSENHLSASQKLKDFADSLSINYIHEIDHQLNQIKSLATNKRYSAIEQKIVPVIFKNFLKRFDGLTSLSAQQLKLAHWHYEKKNYALSYLCLVESIITYVCELKNIPTSGEVNRGRAKNFIIKDKSLYDIKNIFAPANEYRINTAHVLESSKNNSKVAIQKLREYLHSFSRITNM